MGLKNAEPGTPQDTLSSYLDNSATAARKTFVRFENSYVLPIVDLLKALFQAYPIPFTFFSIFVALSFLPVLAFIVVSMATLLMSLTFALCLAIAFSTGVFLLLGSVLLATLGFTLLLSVFLTAFSISAYLFGRLVLLLYGSGRNGFHTWTQEVSHILFPALVHASRENDGRYTSEDSDISVGQEMKDSRTIKTEPSNSEMKLVT